MIEKFPSLLFKILFLVDLLNVFGCSLDVSLRLPFMQIKMTNISENIIIK